MSYVVAESRGGFHVVRQDVGTSALIDFKELGASGDSVLVQNFSVRKHEKQGIVQCFGDTVHAYAFGQDPTASVFSVTLLVFMNKNCESGFSSSGMLGKLIGNYVGSLRVSVSQRLVSITVDGHTLQGTASGLEASVANSMINTAMVTFQFTDFSPPKQSGGSK